ncbi:Fc.00g065680.m01.CDS01 [Cosmosporella sp. VM-42]
MGLRDMLKKKNDLAQGAATDAETMGRLNAPEFTFIRSDTTTQEIIHPPDVPNDHLLSAKEPRKTRHSLDVFRSGRSRSTSVSSQTDKSEKSDKTDKKDSRRLSQRLHLSRAPPSSDAVPENLPEIVQPVDPQDKDAQESQWEKRATILAGQNDLARSRPTTPTEGVANMNLASSPRVQTPKPASSKEIDDDIQEAIRLHEEGDLERSTRIFGHLADPKGANNPLSQVLYGLALRHGWGCSPDPAAAVRYLSAAASNAASIEQLALQAGLKKGGAAKGELVLAIFELANCFRHGWGIEKDAYAAKQYYETAANLGDTDAMNEVAWCYLEGFGCKKDKVSVSSILHAVISSEASWPRREACYLLATQWPVSMPNASRRWASKASRISSALEVVDSHIPHPANLDLSHEADIMSFLEQFASARYYRLAEKAGNKTLGNTWIWKDKYNPPGEGSSKK